MSWQLACKRWGTNNKVVAIFVRHDVQGRQYEFLEYSILQTIDNDDDYVAAMPMQS